MSAAPRAGERSPDIVIVGHMVQEMIHFPDRTIGPVLGSPVAYGSVLAGRLGERVGIVSIIGTDMPDELLQPFREAGVDLRGLTMLPGDQTTRTELSYDAAGNKEIRYPARAPAIQFDDMPPAYHAARVIYVATMDWEAPLETIARLRALPGQLAVDLGGYGGAHSREHPTAAEQAEPVRLRELVGHFDIVRASVEDCAHLLGSDRMAGAGGAEWAIGQFLDWGASVALITLGERGCIVGTPERTIRVPAQRGRVVDTTGAGDSFSTAFLIALMHGGDVESAARFGAAATICVIERSGGVHVGRMPARAEVEARLGQTDIQRL